MNNQQELSINIEKIIKIKTSVDLLGGNISIPDDAVDELEKAYKTLHRAHEILKLGYGKGEQTKVKGIGGS